jgi:hypothetical protein
MEGTMKHYIVLGLIIAAYTTTGLCAGEDMWKRRISEEYQNPLPKKKQKTVEQLAYDRAIKEQEEDERQQLMRKISTEMQPETADRVRKAIRLNAELSYLKSPGRQLEYPVSLEREKKRSSGPFWSEYYSPGMIKLRDLEAYELLEPNVPVPTVSLEPIGLPKTRKRPFHKQLLYTPQENITPDIWEAYEQMKRSKVHAYEIPQPTSAVNQPKSIRNLWGYWK